MSRVRGEDNSVPLKGELARIAKTNVPNGGAISLDLAFGTGRQSLIVTRRGNDLAAFINRCPHARWPLDTFDGRFLFTADGALICAAHSAIFDAMTGACLGGPGQGLALTPVPFSEDGVDLVIYAQESS
jgi:nitrite reductase/ring-hydroxylating ferredoxin subunit